MSRMRKFDSPQLDGILLVDKPTDWTSHDVVNVVRRRFRQNKVGHCGTLDPAATGLLVIVIGKGTKLSQHLSGENKVYEGTITLGIETDTQDAEGKTVAEFDYSHITNEMVEGLKEQFSGTIEQVPPMFSAIKKDGKTMYQLAREGKVVEREARSITIKELEISKIEVPNFDVFVDCTKGTYIRTLAFDMGKALDCGAHLSRLRRLKSGQFNIENSVDMETLKTWELENLIEHILPLPEIPKPEAQ